MNHWNETDSVTRLCDSYQWTSLVDRIHNYVSCEFVLLVYSIRGICFNLELKNTERVFITVHEALYIKIKLQYRDC